MGSCRRNVRYVDGDVFLHLLWVLLMGSNSSVHGQCVLVQPASEDVCVIVGADRPRALTGQDFGWVQAICDRMGGYLSKEAK